MRFVTLLVLCALNGVAAADLYSEYYLSGGGVVGEQHLSDGQVIDASTALGGLRVAAGWKLAAAREIDVRIGGALDIIGELDGASASIGFEVGADHPLTTCWRAGLRVSGSVGGDKGPVEGQLVMAGIRISNPRVTFGIDGVFARNGDKFGFGWENGVLVGAGVRGRHANYAIATSAAAGLLVVLTMAVALRGCCGR